MLKESKVKESFKVLNNSKVLESFKVYPNTNFFKFGKILLNSDVYVLNFSPKYKVVILGRASVVLNGYSFIL
jgi:hypothetical protein